MQTVGNRSELHKMITLSDIISVTLAAEEEDLS